jgi:superfamily II DNA or RNA helicase
MATLFDDFSFGDEDEPKSLVARLYQNGAVEAVVNCLRDNASCFIVAATGCGKTEIAVLLIQAMGAQDGALVISPRIELVEQTAARLRSRGMACGIERAHIKSDDAVTVACYDSLLKKRRYEKFLGVKLVVVDESHLNYTPAAIKMLGYFKEAGAKIVGMTATPRTGKSKTLDQFYGPCPFTYLYRDALEDGYLVPVKLWMTVLEDLDLSQCMSAYGDYDGEKVERWLKQERNLQAVASLIVQQYDHQPSVVFCQTISHSELLRDILARHGVIAAIVHSDTNRLTAEERWQMLKDFEAGKYDVILNVGCLTLGWDFPPIKKVFLARPTMSHDLYGQMFGRGTRPLPGVVDGLRTAAERKAAIAKSDKPYFEVFDFADVSRHNKLVTATDILHPQCDEVLKKRVNAAREKQTCIDIDPILEAERKALAAERAAQDLLEMSNRAGIAANAKFKLTERDAFAEVKRPKQDGRRYRVMLWGKYKFQPFHAVPTNYLRWKLDNCKEPTNHPGYFPALRAEIARRLTGMD